MRISTVHQHRFTADLWKYTVRQDTITGENTRDYYLDGEIKCTLVPLGSGTLSIFTDQDLPYGAELRNLKDAQGTYVYKDFFTEESNPAMIGVGEPAFDVFGNIVGYRFNLAPSPNG